MSDHGVPPRTIPGVSIEANLSSSTRWIHFCRLPRRV